MKLRLFLSPAGSSPALVEADLPEDHPPPTSILLRCFSPPPGRGRSGEETAAWAVPVEGHAVEELRTLLGQVRLTPLGGPDGPGEAAAVELSVAGSQAEAVLKWWRRPPQGWTEAAQLVARLRELAMAGRGGADVTSTNAADANDLTPPAVPEADTSGDVRLAVADSRRVRRSGAAGAVTVAVLGTAAAVLSGWWVALSADALWVGVLLLSSFAAGAAIRGLLGRAHRN